MKTGCQSKSLKGVCDALPFMLLRFWVFLPCLNVPIQSLALLACRTTSYSPAWISNPYCRLMIECVLVTAYIYRYSIPYGTNLVSVDPLAQHTGTFPTTRNLNIESVRCLIRRETTNSRRLSPILATIRTHQSPFLSKSARRILSDHVCDEMLRELAKA